MCWDTSKFLLVFLVLLSEMNDGMLSTEAILDKPCLMPQTLLLKAQSRTKHRFGLAILRLRGGKEQGIIPRTLATAVTRGDLPEELLERYRLAHARLPQQLRWMLKLEMMWRRMLADDEFFVKMSTEALMGCSMQALAEVQQRGGGFLNQLDLVSADLFIVMIQCLACVVYAAPVIQTHGKDEGALGRFLKSCPSSVFGKRSSQDDAPLSALQRLLAFLKPMPALFIIGSGASICGYVYSSFLLQIRFVLSGIKKMVRRRIRFGGYGMKSGYRDISPSAALRLRRLPGDQSERSTTPRHDKTASISPTSPPKPFRTSSQSFHDFRRISSSSPKPLFLPSPAHTIPPTNNTLHHAHESQDQQSLHTDASSITGEPLRGRRLSSSSNPRRMRARSATWSPKFLLSEKGMKRSRTILVSALSRSRLHSNPSVIFRSPTLMHHDAKRFPRSPTLIIQSPSMMKPSPSLFLLQPDASEDESGYTPFSVVLKVAVFVGVYVAVFSNFRGQFMEGVLEQRVLANVFRGSHRKWHSLLSFVLRMINYYIGSAAFVFFYNLFYVEGEEETESLFAQEVAAEWG